MKDEKVNLRVSRAESKAASNAGSKIETGGCITPKTEDEPPQSELGKSTAANTQLNLNLGKMEDGMDSNSSEES